MCDSSWSVVLHPLCALSCSINASSPRRQWGEDEASLTLFWLDGDIWWAGLGQHVPHATDWIAAPWNICHANIFFFLLAAARWRRNHTPARGFVCVRARGCVCVCGGRFRGGWMQRCAMHLKDLYRVPGDALLILQTGREPLRLLVVSQWRAHMRACAAAKGCCGATPSLPQAFSWEQKEPEDMAAAGPLH